MNKVNRFLKTSGVYFIGNVFTKLITFFLLPMYTRLISAADFGYYDLTISIVNLLIPLVFFQIWDSIYRFIFDFNDIDNKNSVINNGLCIMVLSTIVYTVGYIIVSILLDFNYKVLIYLTGLVYAFQYYYTVIARGFMKNTLFVLSGLFNSIITIIINMVLITIFNFSIGALYVSSIIGTIVQIIILELKLKQIEKFKLKDISKEYCKSMIKFCIPLSISTISYWLLSGFTRVVISYYIGVEANGLFAVANKFSSIVILVFNVFQFAWNELAYSVVQDENKEKVYNYGNDIIVKFLLLISAISLPVIYMVFPYFIDEEYKNALFILPISFIGTTISAYSTFLSAIFLSFKKSKSLFVSTIISAIINIIGLVILTPTFGLMGAVLSLNISFVINAIIRMYILLRMNVISVNIKSLFCQLLMLVISTILFYKKGYLLNIIWCMVVVFALFYSFKFLIDRLVNETKLILKVICKKV